MSGVFVYGHTKDGSDARIFRGMYVSPDGEQWSSAPFTDEQRAQEKEERRNDRIYWEIFDHVNGKRTFREEYELVKQKKSGLSARCKKYLINAFENKDWA